MPYFDNNFPPLFYNVNGKTLQFVDILRNASFSREMKESSSYYTNYQWSDTDRIERVSENFYGDSYEFWSISKQNDILDPLIELPKSNAVLENWIETSFPGKAFFVAPYKHLTTDNISRYRPGIYNEGRTINIQGEDFIWGNFTDDNKTSFEFYKTNQSSIPNVVKIDLAAIQYPTDTKGNPISDGKDWYFGSFVPKVGTSILIMWDSATNTAVQPITTTTFYKLSEQGGYSSNDVRIVKVTSVNPAFGTFKVEALDEVGGLPNGIDVFNSITTSTRLFCKSVWIGNCYNHSIDLGRLLITSDISTKITPTVVSNGDVYGVASIVPNDLKKDPVSYIRKFYIYKEVSNAFDAVEYFLSATTNLPVGTSVNPIQFSGNHVDDISLIGRYVTGFYGGIPSEYIPITIKQHQYDVNDINRNIKILREDINTVASDLFFKAIKS